MFDVQLKSRPPVPYLLSDVRFFLGVSITAGFADIIVLMSDLFINP